MPGGGFAHTPGGRDRFLDDQAQMAQALLDACETTGEIRYLQIARDTVEAMLQHYWDDTGGFTDIPRGAAGPGLIRLVTTADAGALPWGAALHDRHVAAVPETGSPALGATPVDPRIKLGGARGDPWDEVRWHGKPGERTVWMITARNRRPQEVRRLALSDTTALAHFQPTRPPLFGATPEAAVAVTFVAGADRVLDQARGLAAIVGVNDDAEFPDSVYLVVTHAVSAATYEAVLAWASRRETPDFRD